MSIHRRLFILTVLILLGAALRFHMLGEDVRFHPDEALFSTFARSAAVHGDWMLPGSLDKPPLSIYLNALSMHFTATYTNALGVLDMTAQRGEFAARLPNIYLSLVLVALTAVTARNIQTNDDRPAFVAAGVMALSPYVLVFSSSAFTDMAMLTFGAAALLAAVRGKASGSGILLALSIASKQQGILYLPLVLMLAHHAKLLNRAWLLRWTAAFALGIVLLLAWDMARPGTSIFALATTNNNPEHLLAVPADLLPRLRTWLDYAGWLLGPPPLTWLLVAISTIYIMKLRHQIDIMLWGFTLAYFALHWLIGFNTYDRYLLPLVPVMALPVGRSLVWFIALMRHKLTIIILLSALLIIALGGAVAASRWQVDLGRDHYPLDRDGEIITLAAYLNAKPEGTIIYDPWLGWEMSYYLGAWPNKRRVHYPTSQALAHDASENPETAPRYLIAPADQPLKEWLDALKDAQFDISADYETEHFVVYRLIPR